MKQKYILLRSRKNAYQEYGKENDCAVSYSTFAKIKPRNVKPQSAMSVRGCLCE